MRSSALWRMRTYARPYVRQMVVMTFVALAGLLAATSIPMVTKAVIDGPLADGDRRGLLVLATLALFLGVLEAFLAFLRRYVIAVASLGMETKIRDDVYAHLQRLTVSFHDNWQSGQLLSRAMGDVIFIRRFFGFGLIFLVVNLATFVVVIVLMVRLYWPLAVVTATAALPIIVFSRAFEKKYRSVSRRLQDQQGDLATSIEESATGVRVIKAFGRHELVQSEFADGSRLVYDSSMEKVYLRGTFWAVLGTVPNLTMAVVLLIGALAVADGSLTKGGLAAFVSLVLMLVWPVESLGEILAMGEEAETAAERIFEVLDTEPDIADRPGSRRLRRCEGRVAFERVSFHYPGTGRLVVRDVSLTIEPGETLALVGVTGSGKTTLASLVPRLYDVSSGRVTLDGRDVRDIRLANLRRHVAVAFEDTTLFSASVRENMLLGKPDATDADIRAALEVAQATFAYDLPWALDTRIGEQGLSLSGGQRQRLALARAVIGRPRVLVLDDPLSALDVHTEALVESALSRVLDGVTALLVVHRPSTLGLADRVALLSGGTIAAVGTHSNLLETVPEYRAILSQEADDMPTPAGAGVREEVA